MNKSKSKDKKQISKKKMSAAEKMLPEALSLPGFDTEELPGKLIVVEGADGSGRSTQIALLKEWLELSGFAVQTMGLRRSNMLARDIDDLLAGNVVGRLTLALLYATDFYDQLQNVMIPALRAGYVVLSDRYAYTLIARAAVRGIDRDYLRGIYEPVIQPDLIFWLRTRPDNAFDREFKKSHVISYWESGRDLNLSNDMFSSFVEYQGLLAKEFARLASENEFKTIDGDGTIPEVNRQLREPIAKLLGVRSLAYRPSSELLALWR